MSISQIKTLICAQLWPPTMLCVFSQNEWSPSFREAFAVVTLDQEWASRWKLIIEDINHFHPLFDLCIVDNSRIMIFRSARTSCWRPAFCKIFSLLFFFSASSPPSFSAPLLLRKLIDYTVKDLGRHPKCTWCSFYFQPHGPFYNNLFLLILSL